MMKTSSINSISVIQALKSKLGLYAELSKLRLSSFVILSSMIGYLFANLGFPIHWPSFLLFSLGGSLVTFASNAINQVIEKDSDRLMKRTMTRPLPESRISNMEAVLFIGIIAVSGIGILTLAINPLTGVLSALSLLLYGFVYTPLKKVSSIAVFVGAIPGALPPLLGYVAFRNQLDQIAMWLFLVQFFWQFPHFWSIAWLSFEDYLKADMMLLPSASGKTKQSAWITFIYSLVLIPLSFYPMYIYQKLSIGVLVLAITSVLFSYLAYRLYVTLKDEDARRLMFGSFAYILLFLTALFFIS